MSSLHHNSSTSTVQTRAGKEAAAKEAAKLAASSSKGEGPLPDPVKSASGATPTKPEVDSSVEDASISSGTVELAEVSNSKGASSPISMSADMLAFLRSIPDGNITVTELVRRHSGLSSPADTVSYLEVVKKNVNAERTPSNKSSRNPSPASFKALCAKVEEHASDIRHLKSEVQETKANVVDLKGRLDMRATELGRQISSSSDALMHELQKLRMSSSGDCRRTPSPKMVVDLVTPPKAPDPDALPPNRGHRHAHNHNPPIMSQYPPQQGAVDVTSAVEFPYLNKQLTPEFSTPHSEKSIRSTASSVMPPETRMKLKDNLSKRLTKWFSRLTLPPDTNASRLPSVRARVAIEFLVGVIPITTSAMPDLQEGDVVDVMKELYRQPLQSEMAVTFAHNIQTLDAFWRRFAERYFNPNPSILIPLIVVDWFDAMTSITDMRNWVDGVSALADLPLFPSAQEMRKQLFFKLTEKSQQNEVLRAAFEFLNSNAGFQQALREQDISAVLTLLQSTGKDVLQGTTKIGLPEHSPGSTGLRVKAPLVRSAPVMSTPAIAVMHNNPYAPLAEEAVDEEVDTGTGDTQHSIPQTVAALQPTPSTPGIPSTPSTSYHETQQPKSNNGSAFNDRSRAKFHDNREQLLQIIDNKGQSYGFISPHAISSRDGTPQQRDYYRKDQRFPFPRNNNNPQNNYNGYYNGSPNGNHGGYNGGNFNGRFAAKPPPTHPGWNSYNDPSQRHIQDEQFGVAPSVEKHFPPHLVDSPDFRREVVRLQRRTQGDNDPQFQSGLFALIKECTVDVEDGSVHSSCTQTFGSEEAVARC